MQGHQDDADELVDLFTDISATTNAIKARAPMIQAMLAAAGGADSAGATLTINSGPRPAHDGRGRQGARHGICR